MLDVVEGLGPGGRGVHRIEHTRADGSDEWSRRLGTGRAGQAWRLRDAGATVALGSDWPVSHYDVRTVLATARTPRGAGLTGLEALEGCTTHAAIAAGESRVTGPT